MSWDWTHRTRKGRAPSSVPQPSQGEVERCATRELTRGSCRSALHHRSHLHELLGEPDVGGPSTAVRVWQLRVTKSVGKIKISVAGEVVKPVGHAGTSLRRAGQNSVGSLRIYREFQDGKAFQPAPLSAPLSEVVMRETHDNTVEGPQVGARQQRRVWKSPRPAQAT